MTRNSEKAIYLIDAHGLCYRAYYAIKGLTNSSGLPTGAILGFINMVRRILKEYGPEHVVVAFDSKGPTNRHQKYEKYKAHRKPMPDDLVQQMPYIKRYVKAANLPVCEVEGYEADDIIAFLAQKASRRGLSATIVTSDKDALQLVGDDIRVLSPGTSSDKWYDREQVVKKYGVPPEKMADLMALTGDPSDNIPGVKGIGKVTAAKLINEFGSLQGIYEQLDKVSSESVRKKLLSGREDAELSRELVEPESDVPVELDLNASRAGQPFEDKQIELFAELEFKRLLAELLPSGSGREENEYGTVNSIVEFEKALKGFEKGAPLAVAVRAEEGRLAGCSFSFLKGKVFYVHFGQNEALDQRVKDLLADGSVKKVVHNAKALIKLLSGTGYLDGVYFDVMVADYLTDPGKNGHDLGDLTSRRLRVVLKKGTPKGNGAGSDLFQADLQAIEECNESCAAVYGLYGELEAELKSKGLEGLFRDVEMPLIEVLANMELTGVGIDIEYLKKSSLELESELEKLTDSIYDLAGERFNINSPKQLQAVLFDKLGLPPGRRTKTGYSTDEEVLRKLAVEYQIPRALLEYRQLSKLKSTYYDSMIGLVDEKTGRLHTTFNQTVTATGRLSSSEPNLQNIPIKSELGRRVRRAFLPLFPGHLLLAADYSQIELRILAHLAGDKTLTEAFDKGLDVHTSTAALIFNTSIKKVTKQMRRVAKTVNFGIIYGMGRRALAADLKITENEAQEFIDAYFDRYGSIKDYMDRTVAEARKNGYVTTLMGRRRYLPDILSDNPRIRAFSERTAINTPVQGSAADIIKVAMVNCHERCGSTDIRMLLQVHDELLFSVPEREISDAIEMVRSVMEGVSELDVKLKVDLETGPNWYEMRKVSS